MIFCGVFKAAMDLSAHGKPFWFIKAYPVLQKNYEWWYMDRSWTFKYKNNDPSQGEKFLGSTSVFSFLCDGWHLFQFFFLNTMILSIVLYEPMINWWADFLVYAVVMKTVFQVCYGKLLVKKQ